MMARIIMDNGDVADVKVEDRAAFAVLMDRFGQASRNGTFIMFHDGEIAINPRHVIRVELTEVER